MKNSHSNQQAIVFLVDNSQTSINGDFYPNRLFAQTLAVERLVQYYLRCNKTTQVALGTLAQDEFGIVASLSRDGKNDKIFQRLHTIQRGKNVQLFDGIKSSFLALHRALPGTEKHIIIFLSSPCELSDFQISNIVAKAHQEFVEIDVVIFGEDVTNIETFQTLITLQDPSITGHQAILLQIPSSSQYILADELLASPLGPGSDQSRTIETIDPNAEPELAQALQMSLQESQDDDIATARAVVESMGYENAKDVFSPEELESIKKQYSLEECDLDNPDIMYMVILEILKTNPDFFLSKEVS